MIRPVTAEEFIYPDSSVPLVEAYGGAFESALIVPHPFVRVPAELAWNVTRQYPGDEQILLRGEKFPWAGVVAETGLKSCARISQALLTSAGALDAHLADPAGCRELKHFLKTRPVWMPVQGRFEPLLRNDIVYAFEEAGAKEAVFVPEFPHTDPVERIDVGSLKSGARPFPSRGTLLAPDHSFLFTVDWDSFFTLFYGERAFVTRVASALNLEGFFATPNTEHAWFNYTMGCATVTLSPEHWQDVAASQMR